MNIGQRIRNLNVPTPYKRIDVVLDTDACNEIDDQYAISYLLKSSERLNTVAVNAAPFFCGKSTGPKDGMEKSYCEILKLLDLLDMTSEKHKVYKGSGSYLPDEKTAVISPAATNLAEIAKNYSPENPLYVVAIGAITNIASALLINPDIQENLVIVWLGGKAHHFPQGAAEFNMQQDIAAARVVMKSDAPFVQLPCAGVVSSFTTTGPELSFWLEGKNKLTDYLVKNTVNEAECYAKGKAWSRVIWDVTAVGWLMNDNERFMSSQLVATPVPEYDLCYGLNPNGKLMRYVYEINRDALMEDLFRTLLK